MTFFKVVLACLLAIGVYNFVESVVELSLHSDVYSCNDVDKNPPDVVKQCKHLTKYQWWGTYYQGVRK